jgi:hypothetical protein
MIPTDERQASSSAARRGKRARALADGRDKRKRPGGGRSTPAWLLPLLAFLGAIAVAILAIVASTAKK